MTEPLAETTIDPDADGADVETLHVMFTLDADTDVRISVVGLVRGPRSAHGTCAIFVNDAEEAAATMQWDQPPVIREDGEDVPPDDSEVLHPLSSFVDLSFPAGDHVIDAHLGEAWRWDLSVTQASLIVRAS